MKNKKALFLIFTPLQLMNAINTVKSYSFQRTDVWLVHKNMEDYINFCRSFFNGDVKCIPELYDEKTDMKNYIDTYVRLVFRALRKRRFINQNTIVSSAYDFLFVPSDDINCRIVFYYLKKKNSNIYLNLLDDGVGTYTHAIFEKKSIVNTVVSKMLFCEGIYDKIHSIYCYRPEDICLPLGSKIKCKRIKQQLNRFDLEPFIGDRLEPYKDKKVIFFDQGIMNEEINACLKKLLSVFGRNKILVKLHPRIKNNINYNDFTTVNDGLPSEFIFICQDVLDVLLVSYSSTSLIYPKLILQENPYIILLNLLMERRNSNSTNKYFFDLNKQLGNDYIKMPTTVDEFSYYIEDYLSKHN